VALIQKSRTGKKLRMKYRVLLVVVIGLMDCLAVRLDAQQTTDSATIYFYRPDNAKHSKQNPTVYTVISSGSRALTTLEKGEYFALSVNPGIHTFSWTASPNLQERFQIAVSENQKAFIEVQSKSMRKERQTAALSTMRELRPVGKDRVFDQRMRTAQNVHQWKSAENGGTTAHSDPVAQQAIQQRPLQQAATQQPSGERVKVVPASTKAPGTSAVQTDEPKLSETKSSSILTNSGVINLAKTGLSAEVVTALIQSSKTNFNMTPTALAELKAANVPDSVILVMVQSAANVAPKSGNERRRLTDELTDNFKILQTSVVTVWSEFGHGSGFIVDRSGLILTNQHVVGPSQYIAVQFDTAHKIPAVLLASSAEKDGAVLWANIGAFPGSTIAPIADPHGAVVVEGERVLTIGSPLNQRKVMTTGIVSKVEPRAIISDININHGNSGGPLFNSLGEVIGITTFGDLANAGGPGISGVIRIEEAEPFIAEARERASRVSPPPAKLLPVDPVDAFPIAAIKNVAMAEKFDSKPYFLEMGDFQLLLMTPTLKYRRNDKKTAIQGTFRPFEEFRGWMQYVGEYKPVLMIRATPEIGESFWSRFNRGVSANYGIAAQAKLRFKTDFYKMRLLCGDKEILPIHPAKIAHVVNESNALVNLKDATYEGFYSYPADAISPACGQVKLEVYSEKNPEKPSVKTLDGKTVGRIAEDFGAYLKSR
jgi:S1-C subfamily serine protease